VGFLVGSWVGSWRENWHRSRLFRVLSLGGRVAFDSPRAVTGLAAALLVGIAATHIYLLIDQDMSPWYFVVYAAAVIAGCALAAGGLAMGRNPLVA
jgi:hypothetical protein